MLLEKITKLEREYAQAELAFQANATRATGRKSFRAHKKLVKAYTKAFKAGLISYPRLVSLSLNSTFIKIKEVR